MNKLTVLTAVLLAGTFFLPGCKYDHAEEIPGNYPVTVKLQLKAGAAAFALSTPYLNAFGESYTISNFLFYVSNVELLRNGGSINAKEPESYHLINAGNTGSQTFTFSSPYTNVTGIKFLVGVDSLRNVSGAQTGALDPMNGMFWTWSSGYIMARMEGNSPQSTQPSNTIVYHIGGFSGSKNATRWVSLEFPDGKKMTTANGDTCAIEITADINKWFNGRHDIKITEFAHTMSPGGTALKIADNYATMFRVTDVKNK
jgi:hypothetical protein